MHAKSLAYHLFLLMKNYFMPDNKKNVGKPDRDRISLSEDYEVQDWSKKFKVTAEELKKAVKQVGPMAKDVEAYLKKGSKN